MPKEVVYGGTFPYDQDSPARSIVEVRWERDASYMQLATRCITPDGETFIVDYASEAIHAGGAVTTAELRSPGDTVVHVAADGWFVDLDRQGINRLIRNLRRARDQAFGRDE